MIGRGDRDAVNRFVVEDLPEIGESLWLGLAGGFDLGAALVENRFVYITQRRDGDVLHGRIGLDVSVALPAHTDDRYPDGVVWA